MFVIRSRLLIPTHPLVDPIVMFLLAKLILDNLMNQTSLEELDEEMRPEILPSELRDA